MPGHAPINLCPGQNGSRDFRSSKFGSFKSKTKLTNEHSKMNTVRCDCFDCIELMEPERFRLWHCGRLTSSNIVRFVDCLAHTLYRKTSKDTQDLQNHETHEKISEEVKYVKYVKYVKCLEMLNFWMTLLLWHFDFSKSDFFHFSEPRRVSSSGRFAVSESSQLCKFIRFEVSVIRKCERFMNFMVHLHKRVKFTKGRRTLWRMFEAFCCFTGRLESLTCRTSPTAIRIIESTQMLLNFSFWLACLLRSPKRKSIIFLRPCFVAVKTACYVKYVNLSAPSFLPCKHPIRILNVVRPQSCSWAAKRVSYLPYFSSCWKALLRKMKWELRCIMERLKHEFIGNLIKCLAISFVHVEDQVILANGG